MSSDAPASGQGILFIVSGPSGAGKTTLSDAALRAFGRLTMSVSCTTRAPRPGERDGVDYHFVDRHDFDAMVAHGDMAEWAQVHGNLYGTPRAPIDQALASGQDMLFDIDVQGAEQMRRSYPVAVAVFLLPPDRATMEARLRGRGTDGEEVVQRRLAGAVREIAHALEYDHVIVNHARDEAIAEFQQIVLDAHEFGPAAMPRHRAGLDEAGLAILLRSFEVAG